MKRDTSTDQFFTLYKNLAAASPEAWVPLPSSVLTGRILRDSEEQALQPGSWKAIGEILSGDLLRL